MPFVQDQDIIQTVAPKCPQSGARHGFCHGYLSDIGQPRIPIARTRLVKACHHCRALGAVLPECHLSRTRGGVKVLDADYTRGGDGGVR